MRRFKEKRGASSYSVNKAELYNWTRYGPGPVSQTEMSLPGLLGAYDTEHFRLTKNAFGQVPQAF